MIFLFDVYIQSFKYLNLKLNTNVDFIKVSKFEKL